MSTIQNYHIYSDETYINKKMAFAIGGLICTPRRAEILKERLFAVRQKFNYYNELKWKKVSLERLQLYKCFADVFLDDPYARFSVMRVTKGSGWKWWGKNEEERFFKTYYVFLGLNTGPYSRYYVYPDAMSLQKGYRWNTLHFLINRSRRDNWELNRKNIRELKPLDSETEDLIQLADLLLGCIVSSATAKAKYDLRQRVLNACQQGKASKRTKIRDWTPQENRR